MSGATDETATAVASEPPLRGHARFAWIVAALSLVIAAALAVPATLYLRRVVPEPLPTRFEVATPPTSDPVWFALSADGRQLTFVATLEGVPRLWVRPLDQSRRSRSRAPKERAIRSGRRMGARLRFLPTAS